MDWSVVREGPSHLGGDCSLARCPDGAGKGLRTLVLDSPGRAEEAECRDKKPHPPLLVSHEVAPHQACVAEDSCKEDESPVRMGVTRGAFG